VEIAPSALYTRAYGALVDHVYKLIGHTHKGVKYNNFCRSLTSSFSVRLHKPNLDHREVIQRPRAKFGPYPTNTVTLLKEQTQRLAYLEIRMSKLH